MKRTKQTQAMVDAMNSRLREYHIKDYNDPGFTFLTWLLIEIKGYHGFLYYNPAGRIVPGDSSEADYLQIF